MAVASRTTFWCLAFSALLAVSSHSANAQSCDSLWMQRNAIFRQAGYCFKLPKAIAAFGNGGCKYEDLKDVPLSDKDRNEIDRLSRYELTLGCNTEASGSGTTSPTLYTLPQGSSERAAIMDAVRLATKWNIKFKVDHLMAVRYGSKMLAIVDVSDASRQFDNSGIFELEGLNHQWRALYTVGGGGGADDCQTERTILNKMIDKAEEYSAPREIFPESFWQLNEQNKSATDCVGSISQSFVGLDR